MPERDVVSVTGPDSGAYLQGQLSQDVLALHDGEVAWSWVLSPQGKVDALVRVTRVSDDNWTLDTDVGWADSLVARLNRFKLRTKVEISAQPPRNVDLGWGDSEVDRILAGFPKMGAELTDKTIPAETGWVDKTVSFTKGCYTGQELVARIDSRGSNVARRLRSFRFSDAVEAGSLLTSGEKPAGTVTSVAHSDSIGWIGLGYLSRNAREDDLSVGDDGTSASVRELPG